MVPTAQAACAMVYTLLQQLDALLENTPDRQELRTIIDTLYLLMNGRSWAGAVLCVCMVVLLCVPPLQTMCILPPNVLQHAMLPLCCLCTFGCLCVTCRAFGHATDGVLQNCPDVVRTVVTHRMLLI